MHNLRHSAGLQSWGTEILSLTAGATFMNLTNRPADEVTILLASTDVAVDLLAAGEYANPTKYVTLDAPSGITIQLAANCAELMFRRNDQSATAFTLRYIWRKFRG